jgi:hypothetical protein
MTCDQSVRISSLKCAHPKTPSLVIYSLQFKNSDDIISYFKNSKLKPSCSSNGSANVLIYLDLWDVHVYRLQELILFDLYYVAITAKHTWDFLALQLAFVDSKFDNCGNRTAALSGRSLPLIFCIHVRLGPIYWGGGYLPCKKDYKVMVFYM